MAVQFKTIVVGAGMMGAACAKYLARNSDGVAVIGPNEPADISNHNGVFASHYDQARITRTIDPDADWALLAHRSIARYLDIADESGIEFYKEAGCLVVGPRRGADNNLIADVVGASAALGIQVEALSDAELSKRFEYFSFEEGSKGIFEPYNAGHINPRLLVQAQIKIAQKAGASFIDDIIECVIDKGAFVEVTTLKGAVYHSEKVIIAAGGFSIADGLLPEKIKLDVMARTVAFYKVPEEQLPLYAKMPSLIYEPSSDESKHIYLLPPVQYPDGKYYLKIGGEPDDLVLHSVGEAKEWFRSGGRESARQNLISIMRDLAPSFNDEPVTMAACVVTYTPSGYPAIGYSSSSRIAVMAGGCGAAAKSSDEIGRLGAELILHGEIITEGYSSDFLPSFT